MMRWWVRLLPLFVVAWLAKNRCEKHDVYLGRDSKHRRTVVRPFFDTMFVLDKPEKQDEW